MIILEKLINIYVFVFKRCFSNKSFLFFLVKFELKLKYRMMILIWIVGCLGSGWVGVIYLFCDVFFLVMN